MLRPERVTPRRVLMTLDAVGGIWRQVLDCARGLAEQEVETVLVGFGPRPCRAQIAEARAISGVRLVWRPEPLDWMVEDDAALDAIAPALDELAARHAVDLLHLNLPSQARGLTTRRPVVVTSHSCLPTWWAAVKGDALPPVFARHRALNAEGFSRADRILAVSRSHAEALARAYGPLPRLDVIHNAAAPATPMQRTGAVHALAVGRWWDEAKGARVLDAAAAAAATPILAIGATEGPNGARAGFAHVRHLGRLGGEATRAAMAHAGIFVSPARYEPFGLAALEAAKEGCALVLADIPTFRELWGGAALLVPAEDAPGFSRAVDALARDEGARAALAARARARAARFTPDAQIARLLASYAALGAQTRPLLVE